MRIELALGVALVLLGRQSLCAEAPPCSSQDPRPLNGGIQLRVEPSHSTDQWECLDRPESRRHLENVERALVARWKVPTRIEPFPSLLADLRFETNGTITMLQIVEASDPKLGACTRNAFAELSSSLGAAPECLVGTTIRVRLLVPWMGAPDDLFSSIQSPQQKDRLRERLRQLGYLEGN